MFEAEGGGGARLQIDVPVAKGGGGVGFSPMQLLLHALAACMSVTVVQILAKQRLTLEQYDISVRGERAEEPPNPYTHIVVEHRLAGDGLTHANLERLVAMVEERYCSVAATRRSASRTCPRRSPANPRSASPTTRSHPSASSRSERSRSRGRRRAARRPRCARSSTRCAATTPACGCSTSPAAAPR
jgi:putative redox protein